MKEKQCAECGATFIIPDGEPKSRKYCCRQCRTNAQRKRDAAKARTNRADTDSSGQGINGLDACMREAEKRGISYGKYMAMRREEKLRGESHDDK